MVLGRRGRSTARRSSSSGRSIVAERWRSGAGRGDQRRLGARRAIARASSAATGWRGRSAWWWTAATARAASIAVSTLEALGAEVTPLFCESDGTFPNHHPDPTVPENLRDLQAEVRRTGAELGIAFDGDADRIGAVDETGEIIYGDQLLVILGRDAVAPVRAGHAGHLRREVLRGAARRAHARRAREPVMWKTGHSLIKAKMKELQARRSPAR